MKKEEAAVEAVLRLLQTIKVEKRASVVFFFKILLDLICRKKKIMFKGANYCLLFL